MSGNTMDYFDWARVFMPVENGRLFETYGSDLAVVRAANPDHVWTLIDGDEDQPVIVPGFCFVNRIAYLITQQPHTDDHFNLVVTDD